MFSPDDLAALERAEEVRIETRAADGAVHRTIIWVVVDGGDVFVRSVRGERGRWYREAIADPDVAIHVDGRRMAARAVPAADPHTVARTSAALDRKYGRDPAIRTMVRPDVLDTTIRLEPA